MKRKIMREWHEIQADVQEMANMSCRPSKKKVRHDHIFDEEKSVKWNREQVEAYNSAIDEEVKRLNTRKNKMRDALYEEICDHIISDCGGKTDARGAKALFDYAREHACGVREVFSNLDDLISLAKDLLGVT